MQNPDVRWKQRFQHFEKAFTFLHTSSGQQSYSLLEAAGLVQAFEFTFELGWKTLKDYLESQGLAPKYPREAIKEAFRTELIKDGHTWMLMLEKRNELAHTYDEENARKAIDTIRTSYLPALAQVYQTLKARSHD